MLAVVALCLVSGIGLAGCGGHGRSRLQAGSLPVILLERLPVSQPAAELQRVVVVRGTLRVQVAPRGPAPAWRSVRQLALSNPQLRRLAQDARAVRGWNKKPSSANPSSACPGRPSGQNVGELLLRVGIHQTLCPPGTARELVTFLGAYLPGLPGI